ADLAARSERVPMSGADRRRFFRRYAVGLTLLVLVYLLCTVLRSLRADFAPEIWRGLGTTDRPGVLAQSELVVGLGVVLSETIAADGIDARHEEEGAAWLETYFGPAVTAPIRLHVTAKRYLCAVDPAYREGLSSASQL